MRDPRQLPILSIRDLKVYFKIKKNKRWPWQPSQLLKAVEGINFDLYEGETLGVVGESGCGKSTLARAILNLIPATSGEIIWLGNNLRQGSAADWQKARRHIQMIFQDPLASLNPRMTIAQIIAEPLKVHRPDLKPIDVQARVQAIMAKVGLNSQMINRYPHEFSGGQCQRVGIARALILEPKLVICDEPVSALDVSIQAQIVNLLKHLQQEMGLALIFIAHDLAVVKNISNRLLVMYLGRPMELAEKQVLYSHPSHPYTRALLSAIPIADPKIEKNKKIQILLGDIPSPISPPPGCVFHTRCPVAIEKCMHTVPQLLKVSSGSQSACLLEKSE